MYLLSMISRCFLFTNILPFFLALIPELLLETDLLPDLIPLVPLACQACDVAHLLVVVDCKLVFLRAQQSHFLFVQTT